jgi:spermidine/putrescine-binding protein
MLHSAAGRSLTRRRFLRDAVRAGVVLSVGTTGVLRIAEAGPRRAEVTIFVWPGLVPDIVRQFVVRPFTQQYPDVSVNLEIGSNAAMYPKILAQRDNPVISGGMFNDIFAQRGIADGLFERFNDELVPLKKRIPPDLMTPGGFGITFKMTPFGIMYNPRHVTKVESWADLYDRKYRGRVVMWDSYFDAYLMAAILAGKGPNVEEGIREWARYKENIGAWVASPTLAEELVDRGEAWLAPHWGAWAEQARSVGKNVAFAIPKEGAVRWHGHLQLFKGFSREVSEMTQRLLNLFLSDICQQALMEVGFFISPVRGVRIPEKLRGNPAIMTAEEAVKKLIPYDYKYVGENIPRLKAMIDRTLK